MSDRGKIETSIDDLLKQAIDKTNGEITYSNTMSVHVGENEVVLEFYFMLPNIPQPILLQRIVLPLKLGMQLAEMLSTGIAQIEQQSHVNGLNT